MTSRQHQRTGEPESSSLTTEKIKSILNQHRLSQLIPQFRPTNHRRIICSAVCDRHREASFSARDAGTSASVVSTATGVADSGAGSVMACSPFSILEAACLRSKAYASTFVPCIEQIVISTKQTCLMPWIWLATRCPCIFAGLSLAYSLPLPLGQAVWSIRCLLLRWCLWLGLVWLGYIALWALKVCRPLVGLCLRLRIWLRSRLLQHRYMNGSASAFRHEPVPPASHLQCSDGEASPVHGTVSGHRMLALQE